MTASCRSVLPRLIGLVAGCWAYGGLPVRGVSAELVAERAGDNVRITIDGHLFAEYRTDAGPKPIVWPLVGPGGRNVTRSYPLAEAEGEERDHVHHRSLWFTHGDVNGVDFWSEGPERGRTVHREYVAVESGGPRAVVAARNDWLAADGRRICRDERRLTFHGTPEVRLLDFDLLLEASDGPLVLGDTKEGTMALRVASSMDVDRGQGGKIVNSEGQEDGEAWGKRAAWVDYSGPVDGEQLGIAILEHPGSFRSPTYWHVRTYGLFAANPFGEHDFLADPARNGSHRLEAGQTLRFRYRLVLHRGDAEQADIGRHFAEFAAEQ